ncbi:MAG TPA: hypothetical protein VG273_16660 [Bryobacteraceae bacterium]|jgi:hypothetical protein|nr:hypothetical protein [Bryobacteraceae bacterium]
MDIHPPEHPVRSLKDFLYHMLTVLLGILIALSLESLIEWNHHRNLVRETRESLAHEIGENQARLRKGLTLAPRAEERLRNAIRLADERQLKHTAPGTALGSVNWATAQSSGALGYMTPVQVQEYERFYVVQQNFLAMQDKTVNQWMELQKWAAFQKAGNLLNGLSDSEVATFKQEAASALIDLQTEDNFARQLGNEYAKAPRP